MLKDIHITTALTLPLDAAEGGDDDDGGWRAAASEADRWGDDSEDGGWVEPCVGPIYPSLLVGDSYEVVVNDGDLVMDRVLLTLTLMLTHILT